MAKTGTKVPFDGRLPTAADVAIVTSKRAGAPLEASLDTLSVSSTKAAKNKFTVPGSVPARAVITPAGTPYLSEGASSIPGTNNAACHPDDYVSAGVRKYMSRDCMSRRDALCKVYRKSDLQTWNIFAGEAGRCHALTDWVLRAPGKIALWFANSLSNVVSNVALAACEKTVAHSDDLVRLNFDCEKKTCLPCSGRYQVMYCGGSKPEELCTGQYELPSYCDPGVYHDVRVPLYRARLLKQSIEKDCPLAEVVMRCKRSKRCDDNACDHRRCNKMRVYDAYLLNHLRADPARLIGPTRMCVNRVPRKCGVLDYQTNYCTEFESAEARMGASPHQRLRECHDAIGAVLRDRIRGSKFRIVGYIGDTQVCNLANDNSSSFYRLGGVTEIVFIMTLLRHIQACTPSGAKLDVRDPDLTVALLKQAGAINVLEGLKRCYGGSLPSVHELISHTSGLPLNITIPIGSIQKVAAESVGRANLDPAELEVRLGGALCDITPLFAPSTCHSYSYVGLEVLRYMLPDWRSNDCSELLRTCQDVGLASADLCNNKVGFHEDSSTVDRHLSSAGQMFMHATGLSARCEELATFLAATRTKHSWANASDSAEYQFAPGMITPTVAVMREQGLSWGYGFCHAALLRDSTAYGEHGLRALLRVGETPGHTTIACMVPACGLSFALTCTTPLVQLCGSACDPNTPCEDASVMGLIGSIVGAILDKMADIPSVRAPIATNWNPTLNEQLCCMPAVLPNFSRHVLYCRNKYALNACELPDLEPYLLSPLVSLLDGARCSLSITKNIVDSTIGSAARKLFGYSMDVRSSYGDCVSHAMAYDHGRKCFRTVCRNTGLLTEQIELATVKASCGMSSYEEPCVSFGGRVYVSDRLYNLLRRTYAPSQQESAQDQIARRISLSDAPISDGNVVDALAKIGHAVSAQSAAQQHVIPTDTVQSGRPRGGFGAGVAVGALAGLGTAAVLAPAYAYAPGPYYDPYYYGAGYPPYPRYWRRPYRRYPPYW